MKKFILTALSLSFFASAAYASRGAGADNFHERLERNRSQVQSTQAVAPTQKQGASREELDSYAGKAILANPENYRTRK